ncbi:hypothetical protein BC30102_2913 [Bacillus cereus]|nr:hypothetical protein BC30102_2913 [Bacillus cereus]
MKASRKYHNYVIVFLMLFVVKPNILLYVPQKIHCDVSNYKLFRKPLLLQTLRSDDQKHRMIDL